MAIEAIRPVIERYANAWVSGNLAAIAACYHDDFTLHYAGCNALSGTHSGKAAALTVLREFSLRSGRELLGIVDVLAGETRGAVIARERLGTGEAAFEAERLLVYTVADGKLRECWVHDRDQAAIDALIGPA